MNNKVDVVTGAFSYSGRFITAQLLARGRGVRTITNHPNPDHPLADRVPAYPLDFDDLPGLTAVLKGADTLYNTYWVRAPHQRLTHTVAVENTRRLIEAAKQAGVRRMVHTSIANPTASDLTYYQGKAQLEEEVKASGLSYAIVRPTLLFGEGDVLINNIAWLLRHLPIFGIPGDGSFRLQPVHVKDHASIMVSAGVEASDLSIDSAGPQTFTFTELVTLLKHEMGVRTALIRMPKRLAMLGARFAGFLAGDMLLTTDELEDVMRDILISHEAPRGTTRLTDWLTLNKDRVGRDYASELDRHYRTKHRSKHQIKPPSDWQ